MKRNLTLLLIILPFVLHAQTYFYVNTIGVLPSQPTNTDPVTIVLQGDLSSTGAYVVSASAMVTGTTIQIDILAADPGGLAVLVPHTENVPVGMLPAGTYSIVINGTFVSDFAPANQHAFSVAGTTSACDSVEVLSIAYAPFDNEVIEVIVQNNSSNGFSYPGFILFDQNNDTLAKEVVNFFGIGSQPQRHLLSVHPAAVLPVGPFTGTIELWSGFYTQLECAFPVNDDLCPAPPCVQVHPFIYNTGGALVTATFDWSILDTSGVAIDTGSLFLNGTQQDDSAAICLPPGSYTLQIGTPQITGGQLTYGLWYGDPFNTTGATFQQGVVNSLPFAFFEACADPGTGITPITLPALHTITVIDENLRIMRYDGLSIGPIEILDVQGRILLRSGSPASATVIPLSGYAPGVHLLRTDMGVMRFLLP